MPAHHAAVQAVNASQAGKRRCKAKESSDSIVGSPQASACTGAFTGPRIQLHREFFYERLQLEMTMRWRILGLIHFIMLVGAYVQTLNTYDPIAEIAAVHDNLRTRYSMKKLNVQIDTPAEVMEYIKTFIDVTYLMASALVDANTMNSIDPMRCFDIATDDVCRLEYWEVQMRRKSDPKYVDLEAVFKDEVSPVNYEVSHLDCRAVNPAPNCMNWTERVNPALRSTVMGLTPEDPVIVEDRISFPFAQVVPLAPIVWQTRAPLVPCSGFGDTYNTKILGAKECSPEIRCNPNSVTSFQSPVPNVLSGRKQSIFVTYETDAFGCFDRSREESIFYDKGWDPWASYADMTEGRRMEAKTLNGKQVFYKFISDVRYLQTPIKGAVYFNKSNPCQACEKWSSPDCVDPLEEGPEHPMWMEGTIQPKCSARREWIRQYTQNPKARKSSFLTAETSELNLAALLITPQMAGLPDITTLVKVTFKIGQSGVIETIPELTSISETPMQLWITWCAITALLALTFPVHDLLHGNRVVLVTNMTICAAVCAYVSMNMYLEFSPPYVLEELTAAFHKNEQGAYFDCIKALMEYSGNLTKLKQAGFYLIMVLFFRLVLALDIHPRLGLVSKVALQCADDTLHFLIQFVLMFSNLSFLAFWSFGERDSRFRTLGRSVYTLFRYFTGDFDFSAELPDIHFNVFLVIYVFVVFVMMVNFLLAIVVNAHTVVTEEVMKCQTEQNILLDLWDICRNSYNVHVLKWPAPHDVMILLQQNRPPAEQAGELVPFSELPGVTADELCQTTADIGPFFDSAKEAQVYIDFYSNKIYADGVNILRETREGMCFPAAVGSGAKDAAFCHEEGRYLGEMLLAQEHGFLSELGDRQQAAESTDPEDTSDNDAALAPRDGTWANHLANELFQCGQEHFCADKDLLVAKEAKPPPSWTSEPKVTQPPKVCVAL